MPRKRQSSNLMALIKACAHALRSIYAEDVIKNKRRRTRVDAANWRRGNYNPLARMWVCCYGRPEVNLLCRFCWWFLLIWCEISMSISFWVFLKKNTKSIDVNWYFFHLNLIFNCLNICSKIFFWLINFYKFQIQISNFVFKQRNWSRY